MTWRSPWRPADFTVTGTDGGADGTLAQAQFANGFGCTGGNVSPQISWKNAPEGTTSFAIRAVSNDLATWHPRERNAEMELRPLAHVGLRDQVVTTAIMLCLADLVETLQGDPDTMAMRSVKE